ncbi:MAG: hypothetical protein ACFFCI_00090 [Promethearchaeota archaeon]
MLDGKNKYRRRFSLINTNEYMEQFQILIVNNVISPNMSQP